MKTPQSLRHLRIAMLFVLSVLVLGTTGYMLLENLSLVDALYTTIGMMSTEGDVVHPLSLAGRLLTIGVIILGVGSLFYTFPLKTGGERQKSSPYGLNRAPMVEL